MNHLPWGWPSRFALVVATSAFISLGSVAPAWSAASDIRFSSIGYVSGREKFAAVINAEAVPFQVRRAGDGSIAFAGALGVPKPDETGHQVRKADFTPLAEEGFFYLNVDGVGQTASFRIGLDVTLNSYILSMKGFLGWRCGSAVSLTHLGTTYAHATCHFNDGYDYSPPNLQHPGTGGWHDAGDYGKYVGNASLTVGMMLTAWEHFSPQLSGVALPIPETGGAIPDYLDEVRWELEWMLKMQDANARVSEQLTRKDFEGFIMPEADDQSRFFIPWSTAATASFAAVMAKAARIYEPYDAPFANQCLTAATSSWNFLKITAGDPYVRPLDVVTGNYHYEHGKARNWMAAELWETTGIAEYLTEFEKGPFYDWAWWDWGEPRPLGQFVYLLSQRAGRSQVVVDRLRSQAIAVADELTEAGRDRRSSYGRAPIDYYWGGNGLVARVTMNLVVANRLAPNPAYLDTAMNQIAWLYGRNYYGRSQVTGDGINPPLFPHHRPSSADNIGSPWPGLLVGGPIAAPGTDWVDVEADYQRNEVAINWNGALTYALAAFVPQTDPSVARIDSVSPSRGPANAESVVTIKGQNFQPNAAVTFGGFAAVRVAVVDSTTIWARVPARPAGSVSVAVTNPGRTAGVLLNGFTYDAAVQHRSFTDDPLIPQSTLIKAVHLTELRNAMNQVRAGAGLGPFIFAEPISAGVVIKAAHILELRNALNPVPGGPRAYTDPGLAAGHPVRAYHLQELRNYSR